MSAILAVAIWAVVVKLVLHIISCRAEEKENARIANLHIV